MIFLQSQQIETFVKFVVKQYKSARLQYMFLQIIRKEHYSIYKVETADQKKFFRK